MSTKTPTVQGDEFDDWMGLGKSNSQTHAVDEDAAINEDEPPHGAKKEKPSGDKAASVLGSMGKKKRALLIGIGGLVVLVALAALSKKKPEAPVNNPYSQVVAPTKISAPIEQEIPGPAAPVAAPALPTRESTESPVVGAGTARVSAPSTMPVSVPMSNHAAGSQVAAPATMQLAPGEAVVEKQVVTPTPVHPVVTETQEATSLQLRVEALEGDVQRAEQARKSSERQVAALRMQLDNQKKNAMNYIVVSVLDDGVVVRDEAGNEKVLTVGARIGQ